MTNNTVTYNFVSKCMTGSKIIQRFISTCVTYIILPCAWTAFSYAAPVEWKVADGGNGHFYEAVMVPEGIDWTSADIAAQARGLSWHLVTITSQEENDFVFNLVSSDPGFWRLCCNGAGPHGEGPWLGGVHVGPGVGDYEWVTGEPFVYSNWAPQEPFGNGERIAFFGYFSLMGPGWNDIGPNRIAPGYIVESSNNLATEVPVDIRPQGCPNPLNCMDNGVLPVAILGTDSLDVSQIYPATIQLEGVAPLRWSIEDVATPFVPFTGKETCLDCTNWGPDGYMDLTLKFDVQAIIQAVGILDGDACLVLELTGNLKEEFGGTSIVGEDVVRTLCMSQP